MGKRTSGIPTLFLMILVLGGFGFLLYVNSSPVTPLSAVIPTQVDPTAEVNAWQAILSEGFGENSTPLPTIAIPTKAFVPPTLPPSQLATDVPLIAIDVVQNADSQVADVITPTIPAPTATNVGDGIAITVEYVTRAPSEWQPPPLIPPLSRDPLGRDHYWLTRPVDSNANNAVLFYYPYGSDGPEKDNPYRVHHGIDMPNPVGQAVRSAGSGIVVWTADGRAQEEVPIFQNSPSYGNVIVIEHDFGYRGKPIYTLYAHLSASLVQQGQVVQAGEVIGQVGNSGRVTGSHVHFEIRVGENAYRSTFNPALWMVPYVGHGVIVGRVVDQDENFVQDADITVRNRLNGLVQDTTTSYIQLGTGFDINSDPVWDENFVVADVPAGRYDVLVTIDGERVIRQVDVIEGTTTFVELAPVELVEDDALTPTVESEG
jgi:murein DD-endopeptidase MepM/ murein hydrolase activator NlpD